MNFLRPLAVLLILLYSTGCAYVATLQGNLDGRVDEWVAEQEYGHALDALSYVKDNHPQHRQLLAKRKIVEAAAARFERDVVRKADGLVRQDKWAQALDLYQISLAKHPRSKVLRQGLEGFRSQQAGRMAELELNLLIQQGHWLEKALPYYREMARVDPDRWGAQKNYSRKANEAQEIASRLIDQGVTALNNKDLGLAARTLPLASRLAPNAATNAAEDALARVAAEQARQAGQSGQRQRSAEEDQVWHAFSIAFAEKRLQEAQLLMNRLEQLDPRNPELKGLREKLQAAVTRSIEENHQEGVSLYGRGLFEEAIARWRKVLELDPEHGQARANLDRAQRVVEKLRQLREKQSAMQDTFPRRSS